MGNINPVYNQNDLLIFFKKVRLDTDKKIIDAKIQENQQVSKDKLNVKEKFSNLWKNTVSFVGGYEKIVNAIDENINNFYAKYVNVITDDIAKELYKDLFKDDKYGLAKLLLSVSIILDNEYEFKYEKEGLEAVSNYLYGNANELNKIKESLNQNYKEIHPNPLSNIQKGILVGTALASLVGVIYLPMIIGGGLSASASVTTATLASMGFGDMQVGLGIITAESILLGAALNGACYGGMKLYNSEKIKQEFKKLSPDKEVMHLAIQCVYIQRIKSTLTDDEFKEQLDNILKSMNTLKADLDYYYFVEREDIKNNREKMTAFHKFDTHLSKILKVD